MNNNLAMEVYKTSYNGKMSFEDYLSKIRKGNEILGKEGGSEPLQSCVASDPEAVKIALEYNESLILSMLV
jgi:hypothetical protein